MIKVYKQKINYHNLNGDFSKGTLWHLNPKVGRYFNEYNSFLTADYVEKNPDIFEEYTEKYKEDKILEEAKKKYPVGTRYISIISKRQYVVVINSNFTWDNSILDDCRVITDSQGGIIYRAGIWAEKIKTTLDSSIKVGDKIYRIYPSGKKVLGIAAAYDKNTWKYLTDPSNLSVTHFISLEAYNGEGGVNTGIGYGLGLERFKYEKAPIFVTEDGVEIFKNDKYWYIIEHTNQIRNFIAHKNSGKGKGYKYFSTLKAAKEWQENNEPKYSIIDVEKAIYNLWDGKLRTDDSVFGKALKEGYTRAFFKELNKDKK